jgi:hypothetical protein
MARSPDVLQDPTPLDSPRVDVRVRIAWLLRVSRAAGRDGTPLSVTEMAHRLKEQGIPASAPSVSGWETGRVTPGSGVLEAYERVLGREPGSLRGAGDMIRRIDTRDRARPPAAIAHLSTVDRATDRVMGPRPTGMDWLHFGEAAIGVRPGLPRRVVRPLADQLVSELSRSVFTAYVTRYEALALLRCGQYAGPVLDAVRAYVSEPGSQVVVEAMSAAAELADPACLRWLLGHLVDDDPQRARGAALGLENLLTAGGLGVRAWSHAVDPFVTAYNAHADEDPRRAQLSALWRALPPPVRAQIAPQLRRPLDPLPRPWDSDRHQGELAFCGQLAARVCDAVGVGRQPLLERLLFEAAFDFRYARSWTGKLLLMAVPFRDVLAAEVAAAADDHPDLVVRQATAGLLVALGGTESARVATSWLDSGDPELVGPALVTLAHAGEPVDGGRLSGLLDADDPIGRRALYHAGMTGHPALTPLAEDVGHRLREGAGWWRRHGRAVTA